MGRLQDYLGNLHEQQNGLWEEFSGSRKHFLKKVQGHVTPVQGTKYKIPLLAPLPSSSFCSSSLVQPLLTAPSSILDVSLILLMHTTVCQHFLKYLILFFLGICSWFVKYKGQRQKFKTLHNWEQTYVSSSLPHSQVVL